VEPVLVGSLELKNHTEDRFVATLRAIVSPDIPKTPRSRIIVIHFPVKVLLETKHDVVGVQILKLEAVVGAGRSRIEGEHEQGFD
jgi:hypothetical protein